MKPYSTVIFYVNIIIIKALTLSLEEKRAKTQELRNRPVFVDTERVPLPTKVFFVTI
jgi:hypothetical protein